MVSSKFIFLVSLSVVLISQLNAEESQSQESGDDGNLRLVYRLLDDCSQTDDLSVCLKTKAVNVLNKALRKTDPIAISDFITLSKDPADTTANEIPDADDNFEASLPRNLDDRSQKLTDMIWDRVGALFTSRNIQLTVPTDIFEGRQKLKKPFKKHKGHGLFIIASMGAMMMKAVMAKIGLIAGKALLLAKIALVLAIVSALKKSSHGGGESAQVVYASSSHDEGGSGGWQRRRSPWEQDEQDLAYNAYQPKN